MYQRIPILKAEFSIRWWSIEKVRGTDYPSRGECSKGWKAALCLTRLKEVPFSSNQLACRHDHYWPREKYYPISPRLDTGEEGKTGLSLGPSSIDGSGSDNHGCIMATARSC